MTNVFRPVDDGVVLPDRVFQGQPWGNVSYGANCTVEDYQNNGLYLEVGSKPTHDQYSEAVLQSEVADHVQKQVELTWIVQPLSDERIAEIIKREEYETEQAPMKGYSLDQATDWVDNKLNTTTLDTVTKTQLHKVFKRIIAFLIN